MATNLETYNAIIATIEGRATTDQESYRIGTRELRRIPLEELKSLARAYYTRIQAEKTDADGKKVSIFKTVRTS